MKKKHLLILLVVIGLLLLLVSYWTSRRIVNQPTLPTVDMSPPTFRELPISSLSNQAATISYDDSTLVIPTFPSIVPTYRSTSLVSAQDYISLANAFGFTGPGFQTDRSNTNIYTWQSDTHLFSIIDSPFSFLYTTYQPRYGYGGDMEAGITFVKNFIASKNIVSKGYDLVMETSRFVSFTADPHEPTEVSPPENEALSLELYFTLQGLPLYKDKGGLFSVTADLGEGGSILSFAAAPPPSFLSPTTPVTTLPIDRAIQSLNAGLGTITSMVTKEDVDPFVGDSLPLYVSRVGLNSVELVYMYLASGEIFPVYRFTGTVLEGEELQRGALIVITIPAFEESLVTPAL